MNQIAEIAKDLLKYISPAAIVIFSIIVMGSVIKWIIKASEAFKTVFKHPAFVLLTLLLIATVFYFYLKFVAPLLS